MDLINTIKWGDHTNLKEEDFKLIYNNILEEKRNNSKIILDCLDTNYFFENFLLKQIKGELSKEYLFSIISL